MYVIMRYIPTVIHVYTCYCVKALQLIRNCNRIVKKQERILNDRQMRNSMAQGPLQKSTIAKLVQNFSAFYWTRLVYNCSTPFPVLRQVNPLHNLTLPFFDIQATIMMHKPNNRALKQKMAIMITVAGSSSGMIIRYPVSNIIRIGPHDFYSVE